MTIRRRRRRGWRADLDLRDFDSTDALRWRDDGDGLWPSRRDLPRQDVTAYPGVRVPLWWRLWRWWR